MIPEAFRPLGWLAIAVAGVLLSRAVAFDRDWLQLTELVLAGTALVIGLGLTLRAGWSSSTGTSSDIHWTARRRRSAVRRDSPSAQVSDPADVYLPKGK